MKNPIYLFVLFLFSGQLLIAQTPQELKSWLPSVDGWTITEEIEVFNPDNLFDRINGAAPLFVENNFREMTSMEYKKGSDYITIQAYRHASPEDAFGMYASERSTDLPFLPIGGEAQGDESSLFFFAGDMYLKMWSYGGDGAGAVLKKIAEGLAKKIDATADYPTILKQFPKEGQIPYSAAYVTSNYIGHEFLQKVYTMNYEKNGQAFQLFMIDAGTEAQAKDMLTKYFTFAKQPVDFEQGKLLVKDRYNGDIPVLWKGQYITGIFSENGDVIEDYDLLSELLNK